MQKAWRMAQWYFDGRRRYTKAGFESAAKKWSPEDLLPDLSGRSILVTGANSGIGKATALEVAKRKGNVHMVCRDRKRGEEALAEIKTQSGNENVHLHVVDLAAMKDVRAFCQSFKEPLHCLVNNAGVMLHERKLTEEGHDTNFTVNVLSPMVLTFGLMNNLQQSGDGRVVFVSSGGMLIVGLDMNDIENKNMKKYDGTVVYSHNKRAQVNLVHMLAGKCRAAFPNVTFYSMHPGWADTPAVQTSIPDFHKQHSNVLRTSEQGADTVVWLCAGKTLETPEERIKLNGKFFFDRAVEAEHLWAAGTSSPQADLDALWKYTVEAVGSDMLPAGVQ
eukprot:GDKI01031917.1.p1 GENE.GDKI01031917.1~~GDKI01031917.1.p1  ORF type:complete len:333 (+),score=101.14 GDKI01031917.1:85-1083(+)